MGFIVAKGTPTHIVNYASICSETGSGPATVFMNQLVKMYRDGITPMDAADGAGDVTGKQIIHGLVLGFNYYPMTEQADQATGIPIMKGATTAASQRAIMKMGQEGKMFPKGDPAPLAKIAKILYDTRLQGSLYKSTYGAPPTILTAIVGSSNGSSFTSNACDFVPPANYTTTVFCRTGSNAGLYRVPNDSNPTVCTLTKCFPNPIAVGDTFIRVPYVEGISKYANFGSDVLALYFDIATTGASGPSYFIINVHDMDLRTAGQETITFSFMNLGGYPI